MATEQARRAGQPGAERSVGELVSAVSRELSALVHQEMELAKVELSADAKRAGIGAGFLGGAGFCGVLGLILLSVAAALGLAHLGLDVAYGFLIVAGAYLLLAGGLALGGRASLVRLTPPRRTIQTVKDDLRWARHPTEAVVTYPVADGSRPPSG